MSVEHEGAMVQIRVGVLVKRDECTPDIPVHVVDCPSTDNGKLPRINPVYGRCSASMEWLDTLYRNYIQERHKFMTKSVAIKAVAGSGKTTTLLNLAKRFQKEKITKPEWQNKTILYVAFNKQLVDDIKRKLRHHQLANTLVPLTFDALIRRVAESRFREQDMHFHLVGSLTPTSLTEKYNWFSGKAYKLKKSVIQAFAKFCQDPTAKQPQATNRWVTQLWEDTLNGSFLTFDGLRKRAYLEHWMQGYLDAKYGIIFVDEAQDFDPIMLDILKHDANAPKVFVGDPRQQIYEWRGTVNAFEHLPDNTLMLEFYKTFRMGEPATSHIATRTNTPMISGIPDVCTELHTDTPPSSVPDKYTYLFRSWKGLLTTSQTLATTLPPHSKLWVHDYDRQMTNIERLHERLTTYGPSKVATDEYEDDLPSFLMKLSSHELKAMRDAIESRRVFAKPQAHIQLYTIHSFKGLEADVVRVCGDIDPVAEPNLYYVALTRGREHIYCDPTDASLIVQPNQPSSTRQTRASTRSTRSPSTSPSPPSPPHSSNPELVTELKAYRYEQATTLNIQAYRIFTNQTMEHIAMDCPQTPLELLNVNGIGKKKLHDFGEDILSICKRHKKSDDALEPQTLEPQTLEPPRTEPPTAEPPQPSPTVSPTTIKTRPTPDTPLLFCYYDLEATGLDTSTEDIIQISIQYTKYEAGHKTPLHTFTTFVNTHKPIPYLIQSITKITPQHIQEAPFIDSVLTEVQGHVYDFCRTHTLRHVVWIAHNGNGFDHKMLQRNCRTNNLTMLTPRDDYNVWYADTLVMARKVFPQCPMAPDNNKLQTLYQWCHARRSRGGMDEGTDVDADAPLQFHRADADVKAMELVLDVMMELTPASCILHTNLQATVQPPSSNHTSRSQSTKDALMHTVLTPDVQQRVLCLMVFRDALSTQLNKSTASVMSDTLLLELARTFPQTLNELLTVKGLSMQKVQLFGGLLLEHVSKYNDGNDTTTITTTADVTDNTYEAIAKHHKRNVLRDKGFTETMESKLAQYNATHHFDRPLTAQIARNAHQKACTRCQTMNGFGAGSLFFGGRQASSGGFVKYCFACVKEVIC